MWDSVIVLVPTVVLTAAFFVALRLILRADRNERRALARLEAEYEKKSGVIEEESPASIRDA